MTSPTPEGKPARGLAWHALRRIIDFMRVMRPLPLIGLLLVVWVQEAHACSCRAIVNKRTQNWERPWAGRDVVFTGYAIEIDQSYDPVQRTVTRLVRFVTEQSWRGALPDTITLFVNADAPCSQYSPGWRYLVTANWDARARGRLTTAVCDYSLGADWKVARQLREEEGPPGWTAPPMGSRDLDRGAFPLGTPIPRTPAAGLATFIPERGESKQQRESV